jgi:hypothetical protein
VHVPDYTLSADNIMEEVKDALGDGGVDVEILDNHVRKAMRDTIRVYNHHKPMVGYVALTVSTEVKRHDITSIHPRLTGIIDVTFINPEQIGVGQTGSMDPWSLQREVTQTGGGTFGQIYVDLAYIEEARRVMSSEPEWKYVQDGDTHYLYVSISVGMLCAIEFTWDMEAVFAPGEDDTASDAEWAYGLKNVPRTDEDWFMGHILARCKQTLGRILRKHGGTASSEGGADPTDGEALVQEGKDEEAALVLEIKKRRRPLPPVTG